MNRIIANPSETGELIKKYNIKPSKRFGQNFLIDANTLNKIIKKSEIKPADVILEVGPGLGGLTQLLALTNCKKIYAVEFDRALYRVIKETLSNYKKIQIIEADAMTVDIRALKQRPNKFISNLPYNIASPILVNYLHNFEFIKDYVIMIQKEVASRILADPGSGEYGALTVKINLMAETEFLTGVSKNVFYPKPKVDSAVIHLSRKKTIPNAEYRERFFKFVNAAFAQRRKKAINSLSHNLNITKDKLEKIFIKSGIDAAARAENLSLNDYQKLYNSIY